MKILFIPALFQRLEFPASKVRGGLEKVELDQLNALVQTGADFTIAAPADAVIEDGVKFHRLTTPSRASMTDNAQVRYADFLNEIHESGLLDTHDVVLSNGAFSIGTGSTNLEWLGDYAHKFRVVMHEPQVNLIGARSLIGRICFLKYITAKGGRTATVEPDGDKVWDDLEAKLRDGSFFRKERVRNGLAIDWLSARPDGTKSSHFTDFYEVMRVDDDFIPISELKIGTNITYTSRPQRYKGFLLAVDAVAMAGVEGTFVGNTMSPSHGSETRDWESCAKYHQCFRVDQSHAGIMRDVARGKVFLQPTASESAGGIVSFEAAAHGVPVVTTTDTGRRYLEPYGLYNPVERNAKAVADAIYTVPALTIRQRREVAEQVREDFSQEKYATRLLEFLS